MAKTLYVKSECPHCAALRKRLSSTVDGLVVVDIDASPQCVPELLKLTGRKRIVPVFVDGTKIEVAPDGGSEF